MQHADFMLAMTLRPTETNTMVSDDDAPSPASLIRPVRRQPIRDEALAQENLVPVNRLTETGVIDWTKQDRVSQLCLLEEFYFQRFQIHLHRLHHLFNRS